MPGQINFNILFNKIKSGNTKAFEELFNSFYGLLCNYANQFLQNNNEAEEIVQDIFVKIWEKRSSLKIDTSVKNYLFRSVRNKCLNKIQHDKVKNQYSEKIKWQREQEINDSKYYTEPGLLQEIEKAIDSLPEKRKEIFRLSRDEGLKYKEIANKLNISIKTVEAQMGLALKSLRIKLKIFNPDISLFQIFYSCH